MVEGEDVLFLVNNLPGNLTAFAWFKGRTNRKHGIALYAVASDLYVHSDRETLYNNGSLMIHNVTQKDRGYYTLRTFNKHAETVSTTFTFLHVNRKWFFVNLGCWVGLFPLDIQISVRPGLCLFSLDIVPMFRFEHLSQDTRVREQWQWSEFFIWFHLVGKWIQAG